MPGNKVVGAYRGRLPRTRQPRPEQSLDKLLEAITDPNAAVRAADPTEASGVTPVELGRFPRVWVTKPGCASLYGIG